MADRIKYNKQMKEDMIRTNKLMHNNKIQAVKSHRDKDKKSANDQYNFINTNSEALRQAEFNQKNSYVQILKDSLKRQINEKVKNKQEDSKRKVASELNSTGLNLPCYSDLRTTACSDCGVKYDSKMLTKVKK
jgi:hypothetical protein